MSIQTLINYNSGANFQYDTSKIDFSSGKAKLAFKPAAQSFQELFASATGFNYDLLKTQVNYLLPANTTGFADYSVDADLNFGNGDLTGTLVGGAVVAGGVLDLTAGGYCKYINGGKFDENNGSIQVK